MRKRIAVFMCAISFSNQRKILDGVLETAKKNNIDVFVFTCLVNKLEESVSHDGAFSVMELPDLDHFDGAIVMKNTIRNRDVAETLIERLAKTNIPTVSIEEKIDGLSYVGFSNYEAQKKVVDHLIKKHKCRDIVYVSGYIDSVEGKERLKAYQDAMEENTLSYDFKNVYLGNYVSDSGRRAVSKFMKREKLPDAIVCANDGMAIGVVDELRIRGVKVPEDVIVTGFDNDTYIKYAFPSLTSLDPNQYEMGKKSVEIIVAGTKDCVEYTVDSELKCRESCGCYSKVEFDVKEFRDIYSKEVGITMQAVDCIKDMSIELSAVEDYQSLYKRLERYVIESDMQAFFLCLNDAEDKLNIPFAYLDNEFTSLLSYPRGQVLPDLAIDTEDPSFYIVNSLYYGKENFGYIIQRNSWFALASELANSWVVNVAIACENIKKTTLIKEMFEKINAMWMFDTLTNLYNRGGFFHFAEPMLEEQKRIDGKCFLIFMDLDGLKKINDTQGHIAGDAYINAMASIITDSAKNIKQKIVYMRYGGDEFVLFGVCDCEQEAQEAEKEIKKNILIYNRFHDTKELSCSMGITVYRARDIEGLAVALENADKKMYESKRQKKEGII